MSSPAVPDPSLTATIRARNGTIYERDQTRQLELPAKFLVQRAHLTTPATVAKYVEAACTRSEADLVMLDLEDSIPRGSEEALRTARNNVIRAFREFDWGRRLRFFRPRGMRLDPGHEDIQVIVAAAGPHIDGLIYPKIESPDEIRSLDQTLTDLEKRHGLPHGQIRIEALIESAAAEEAVFEIARESRRLVGLIFGAFDYWGSLRMVGIPFSTTHPLVDQARARIVKAAASVGVPAIAEMTLNYPTKDKSPHEQHAALDECRRDAEHAKLFGFRGKWTGIPVQTSIAVEVFSLPSQIIDEAIQEARMFLEAEKEGRGAIIIKGKMADRATDRINRVALQTAFALGLLDDTTARELGIR